MVVAVQLAEHNFFHPDVIAVDEGALQPEVDTLMLWEYYPLEPVFLSPDPGTTNKEIY